MRMKRIARWWTVGIVLGALLIGAGVGANTAAAGGAPAVGDSAAAIARAWAYVPEYLSAPVIESGVVVDRAGHPVPGATVVLFPVLRNPANGTIIAPLTRGATDANGRYELRLPTALDSTLANKWTRGALNLHIEVFYPNTVGGWFVPIPAGQLVAAAAKIVLKPEAETYSATVPANGGPGGNCSTDSKPTTIAPVKQIVGYKSSLDPKLVSAQFSYSTGYTVTTGVGFSAGGSKGGISASGSTTTSDTETVTLSADYRERGSNYYEADSVWTWQKYQCFHPGGHGGGYWTYAWYLIEDAVGGSAGTPGAPAVKAGYCYLVEGPFQRHRGSLHRRRPGPLVPASRRSATALTCPRRTATRPTRRSPITSGPAITRLTAAWEGIQGRQRRATSKCINNTHGVVLTRFAI